MALDRLRNLQVMYGNCRFERLCLLLVHLGHDVPAPCVPTDDIHPTSPVFPILCSG